MLLKKKIIIASIIFKRYTWLNKIVVRCYLCKFKEEPCYCYCKDKYKDICSEIRLKFTGKTDNFTYVIEKI